MYGPIMDMKSVYEQTTPFSDNDKCQSYE